VTQWAAVSRGDASLRSRLDAESPRASSTWKTTRRASSTSWGRPLPVSIVWAPLLHPY